MEKYFFFFLVSFRTTGPSKDMKRGFLIFFFFFLLEGYIFSTFWFITVKFSSIKTGYYIDGASFIAFTSSSVKAKLQKIVV